MLDILRIEDFIAGKGVEAARGGDDDVGALCLVTEEFSILANGRATEERADADVGHVLRKPRVLVLDLERELAGVTEDNDGNFAIDRFKLLQRSQDEHCRLSVTRLRLAQDIHPQDCLGNALLLDCNADIR